MTWRFLSADIGIFTEGRLSSKINYIYYSLVILIMNLDRSHLSALVAIIREGSFDKAAQVLHVTSSAISQRIRTLEEQMGTVLIVRESPCRPTFEGEKIYRHGLQVELLERDLIGTLHQTINRGIQTIPVAVNADSLATWFVDVIRVFHEHTGAYIEAFTDNQDYTAEWLREGKVLGAVTSLSKAVQGCRIEKLKPLRYIPMASPAFIKRYFPNGLTQDAFQLAPLLMFDRKDLLQHDFIKKVTGKGLRNNPPCHFYPSSNSFQDMAVAGLGWGLAPEQLIQPYLKPGKLVVLPTKHALDVPLYWQSWRLSSPTMDALTKAVKKAAG
jgi:LysR family transcriptional regulator (chromosome initiation inhibitor)